MHSIVFQTFFVQVFKIVVETWKFTTLLLSFLWGDWPIFMISGSNKKLQQEFEYTLLEPDCHSWWISKKQSGREHTLKDRYAIKFCSELGKNATEPYRRWASRQFLTVPIVQILLPVTFDYSVFEWHKRFKECRESVRDDERCGRSKEVNTQELIGQRFRFRVTMLRF